MNEPEPELDRDPALTPEERAKIGAGGTPVVLADGNTWLLADGGLANDLDELRDQLDDDTRMRGSVALHDVAEMACQLLIANYELAVSEVFLLLAGAVNQTLADAVLCALFGPQDGRRTYSTWAASAMIANGIDPDRVPSRLMPHVLAHLEFRKACIPRGAYIESAEAARKIAGIRARAVKAEKPRPPEEPPAATPVPAEPEPDGPAPLEISHAMPRAEGP